MSTFLERNMRNLDFLYLLSTAIFINTNKIQMISTKIMVLKQGVCFHPIEGEIIR